LAVGALTLSPTFDPAWLFYTASTTDATNTITATSTVDGATVVILNGETPVDSGDPATWVEGVNHVTVTVEVEDVETAVYHVWVTYVPED